MRSRLLLFVSLFAWLPGALAQYKIAVPGYRYEFPRDHFNHPDFQTEWWYTTGNLTASDGRHYGFELTFFRQGVDRDPGKTGNWDIRDLYLAHLALSDLDGGKFYHAERTNRAGPGLAGIDEKEKRIWNGNWEIRWNGEEETLTVADERFSLSFSLLSEKPPIIHGENGVSQKAAGAGHASHYISFTRLQTRGTIGMAGKSMEVRGTSWMDHEFFTHSMEAEQVGWDWLSVQLEDNTELMLYQFRRKDGLTDPFSSGTYVDAQGRSVHLTSTDFRLVSTGETWTSDVTTAKYPVAWRMEIPKLGLRLAATTLLKSQELAGGSKLAPSYWEGAIAIEGTRGGASVRGVGYLEMTGYERPMEMGR
ncbi:MAG TPA: lipocalin-like domain-containing protein [Candidatus Acidoferrales bacterium]|jgi:predicted secreted hydrolase|nr:lipocalin-like domain-containing protein [Candidatus Acidoferrales bacterium]